MDTAAGFNLIRCKKFPFDLEKVFYQKTQAPNLNDANGNPLNFGKVVWLTIRFRNTFYKSKFIIAERLAVDAIVGTYFMN